MYEPKPTAWPRVHLVNGCEIAMLNCITPEFTTTMYLQHVRLLGECAGATANCTAPGETTNVQGQLCFDREVYNKKGYNKTAP